MRKKKKLSFYTGAALSADSFATLATFDGRGHPAEPGGDFSFDTFDRKTGMWRHVSDGKDHGEDIAAWSPGGRPQAAAINRLGGVLFDDLPIRLEQPYPDARSRGAAIGVINNRLYAIGDGGHFFWRDADTGWTVLDPEFFKADAFSMSISKLQRKLGGLSPDISFRDLPFEEELRISDIYDEYTATFYTITGTGHDNLYLAGPDGRMLHFDGQRISKLDSGVKNPLTSARIASDGTVYVCGARGGSVILAGDRNRGFAPVLQMPESRFYPYKMAFLGPDLYIADVSEKTGGLYKLTDGQLTRVLVPGAADPVPVWQVDVADGVLWALEAKALNRFDGTTWDRFESPFV
ncbi:hypothetical protein [Roseinatronobacter monicus]|uniref:Uncharacterized protein n=1 Tax=Roseinatronobacter monicus TaxID=393481 RepID=A0A543K4J2_9RHOB|nr:hypothetical protein [Roseinatronobacter monicus]TQM89954.1 hypothetical protein BD293_4273 [Roseinatronobacter monicus]